MPSKTRYIIAYSGGLDSQCLLHMLAHGYFNSADLSIEADHDLLAVHVHHGLSKNADKWEMHCAATAQTWGIPFQTIKIDLDQIRGGSLEAAARKARYAAFAKFMQEGDQLLTAHHQDDQAETFLLQALRGGGVNGLSAMPEKKKFSHGWHLRPLLKTSRIELEKYAKKHHLCWVEDESNDNLIFSRNYLRHIIMPKLKNRWPHVNRLFSNNSRYCAEASMLITELADIDLKTCLTLNETLLINALSKLSFLRQKNVVRRWLQRKKCILPHERILNRIFTEIIPAGDDAAPSIEWPGAIIKRFRKELYVVISKNSSVCESITWDWREPLALGKMILSAVSSAEGLCVHDLPEQVNIEFRTFGKRIRLLHQPQSRCLKKLLQSWHVPPWERAQIPLIFIHNQLVAAPPYYHARSNSEKQNDKISFIISINVEAD